MSRPWQEHVMPHGPLVELIPGLWQVTGDLKNPPLPRNMVVARLKDGGLWLHSVVALDESGVKHLESLGKPTVMVVPNGFHRIDAGVFKERYPSMKVVCPAAARKRVEQVVAVDGTCEEMLPAMGVRVLTPEGTRPGELAYDLEVEGGRALVVADLLFNIPNAPAGFAGFVLKHLTKSVGPLGVSRVFRLVVLKDRRVYARWVEGLAEIPGLKVLAVAHGDAVSGDVSSQLHEAAARI